MRNVNLKFLREIRRRIIEVCGFSIVAKKDCRALAELIRERTGETLSEATLYRLFLSNENGHKFYLSTYNILSVFVGFANWESFCHQLAKNEDSVGSAGVATMIDSKLNLLDHVFAHNGWHIAKDYFDHLNLNRQDEVYHLVGWTIYNALKNHPEKEREFYNHFAGHAIVRAAFFELACDPDFHLPNYAFGLERYIAEISNMPKEVRLRDTVFAQSLLVRHAFLDGQQSKVIWRFEKFLFTELEEEALRAVQPALPLARLFQAKWFYLSCLEDVDMIREHQKWWFLWVESHWQNWSLIERKAVLYCAAEASLLTRDDGQFYRKMIRIHKQFIGVLFGQNITPSLHDFLMRTEFNGILIQKNLRISN